MEMLMEPALLLAVLSVTAAFGVAAVAMWLP
jgi:hypothetical protein